MNDLISRQMAIDEIEVVSFDTYGDYIRARNLIEDLPSAQPEQETGEWIKEDRGGVEYTAVCSKCGYATFWSDVEDFRYCPNCGKKMEWNND